MPGHRPPKCGCCGRGSSGSSSSSSSGGSSTGGSSSSWEMLPAGCGSELAMCYEFVYPGTGATGECAESHVGTWVMQNETCYRSPIDTPTPCTRWRSNLGGSGDCTVSKTTSGCVFGERHASLYINGGLWILNLSTTSYDGAGGSTAWRGTAPYLGPTSHPATFTRTNGAAIPTLSVEPVACP